MSLTLSLIRHPGNITAEITQCVSTIVAFSRRRRCCLAARLPPTLAFLLCALTFPRCLTLHPGLRWWNRENRKEIHEEKHKCSKVAASTVREKRRWMLFLYYTFSKPRSDNVGLLTLQKRRFVLLLFTTVPCCHPSQCLWVTLGKPPKHFLPQFFLSTELSFPSPPLEG